MGSLPENITFRDTVDSPARPRENAASTVSRDSQWDLPPTEAIALQRQLATRLVFEPLDALPESVAGVDVSIRGGEACAAVVMLAYPSLELLEERVTVGPVTYPYIPGLLSFREAPTALKALDALTTAPALLIFDGQGFAHPRRLGLASHLGLLLGIPSIGCAKSRLCGTGAMPGSERGAYVPLVDGDEVIGAVVRTRTNVRPVYVSAGHLIGLEQAVEIVLDCCRGYRLPEPTRLAHLLSTRKKDST